MEAGVEAGEMEEAEEEAMEGEEAEVTMAEGEEAGAKAVEGAGEDLLLEGAAEVTMAAEAILPKAQPVNVVPRVAAPDAAVVTRVADAVAAAESPSVLVRERREGPHRFVRGGVR